MVTEDSLLEQLDAAVRSHSQTEHPGQLVIGWALVVASTEVDADSHRYDTVVLDGQPAHSTVGLFDIGRSLVLETKEE